MYRHKSSLILLFLWVTFALGIILSKPSSAMLPFSEPTTFSQVSNHNEVTLNINMHPHYKKIQYSKKINRYSWLKDKKLTVFADYNKLSRTIFAQYSPPPINSTNVIVTHMTINEYNQLISVKLMNILSWIQNPPDTTNRLNGWKESNILYKGVITYYPFHISTII